MSWRSGLGPPGRGALATAATGPGVTADSGGPPGVEGPFELVDDGATLWRFDVGFLRSNWACIWGRGCLGILSEPAAELGQGCCSVGAEFEDEAEARLIGALGATLTPERFQYQAEARSGGVDRRLHSFRLVLFSLSLSGLVNINSNLVEAWLSSLVLRQRSSGGVSTCFSTARINLQEQQCPVQF